MALYDIAVRERDVVADWLGDKLRRPIIKERTKTTIEVNWKLKDQSEYTLTIVELFDTKEIRKVISKCGASSLREKFTDEELEFFDSCNYSLHYSSKQSIRDWFWNKALDTPSVEGISNVKQSQANRLVAELEHLNYKLHNAADNTISMRKFENGIELIIVFDTVDRTVKKYKVELYESRWIKVQLSDSERDLFLDEEYIII